MDEADAIIYDAGFHAGARKVQFQVKRLEEEVARLRAALEWYADEENLIELIEQGSERTGQRARDALRRGEGDEMMTADLSDRLADALGRIIDDPLVVKLLLYRDPKAWADAVNVLAEAEMGEARTVLRADEDEWGPDSAQERLERGPR